ncbi:XPA protein C-terminus-domain-containing protein [Lipomyces japonicus]|uniref:XPA protein C-terminus-domain-containing protein n=1 Tax=Lipomyces japonicus TaxID=56871 RepID=UPI0034CD6541
MSSLSEQQLSRIQENRQKARERLAQRAEAKARDATNQAAAAAATSTTPSQGSAEANKNFRDATKKRPYDDIRPAKKFTNYIEYDFSKIKDSKGGFVQLEDSDLPSGMTLEEWKKKNQKFVIEPERAINPAYNPKCFECGSFEIDFEIYKVFKCRVCKSCKKKIPDKYSLLTKTECREDYLLTDPELRDAEELPHIERPNPHKTTYNNMMLYLRYQVEEFAFKKWESPEGLDAEFERRVAMKKEKKDKKFAQKLKEMRKKTRTETWNKRLDRVDHQHEWSDQVEIPGKGIAVRKCVDCGLETEEIVF